MKEQNTAKSGSASKRNLILLVVALVIIIVVAAVAYNALAPSVETESIQTETTAADDGTTSDEELSHAPDFTMTAEDGTEVSLSSFEGMPVILNFWASTCGPCQREMPEFQSAYEQYGSQIQFVMVNVPDFNGETRERAQQMLQQNGYTFPVFYDDTTQGQVQYGISSIPQTFFITPDGKLAAYAAGAINAATLERGVEMLLNE